MKGLHDFLTNYNIKFSLDSGSLFGTIGHNSFSPQDNDIVNILINEEFHKLVEIVNEFNGDKYLVVKPFDDTQSTLTRLIKIYDKRVCMKEFDLPKVHKKRTAKKDSAS